jgi:hypothetical protein
VNVEEFVGRLDGVMGRGPRWRAICPAHQSRHKTKTLSILDAGDGRILVKCHAGCAIESICGALGIDLGELFPPRPKDFDDRNRKPPIRKPWTNAEVANALEPNLTSAFLLLAKVGSGARLTKEELKEAVRAAEACIHLLDQLRE